MWDVVNSGVHQMGKKKGGGGEKLHLLMHYKFNVFLIYTLEKIRRLECGLEGNKSLNSTTEGKANIRRACPFLSRCL